MSNFPWLQWTKVGRDTGAREEDHGCDGPGQLDLRASVDLHGLATWLLILFRSPVMKVRLTDSTPILGSVVFMMPIEKLIVAMPALTSAGPIRETAAAAASNAATTPNKSRRE